MLAILAASWPPQEAEGAVINQATPDRAAQTPLALRTERKIDPDLYRQSP